MPRTLHDTPSQRAALRMFVLFLDESVHVDTGPGPSGAELLRLADTLGLEIVGHASAGRGRRAPSTVIGPGRLAELTEQLAEPAPPGFDAVLVDAQLTPRQQLHLEQALGHPVWDRTDVILRIFEQRAQTREARLEVELARLRHDLPRMRQERGADDRRGGGGRGERGHTNVELAKMRARDRIAQLNTELEELHGRDDDRRSRRSDAWLVTLAGYTNAGKSTLMRSLSGADVLAEDKLFATLGTTVRQLDPPASPPILVSDTVGFIQNLPHELVASFRSTLEQARAADLLLVVVDAADPEREAQYACVLETLNEVLSEEREVLQVFNKVDALDDNERAALAERFPEAELVSARDPASVARLRARIESIRAHSLEQATVHIPWRDAALVGELRASATVLAEDHDEQGTLFRVQAASSSLARWSRMPSVTVRFAAAKPDTSGDEKPDQLEL